MKISFAVDWIADSGFGKQIVYRTYRRKMDVPIQINFGDTVRFEQGLLMKAALVTVDVQVGQIEVRLETLRTLFDDLCLQRYFTEHGWTLDEDN